MAKDNVAYWTGIANEDLEVAEDLFKTKRWLDVDKVNILIEPVLLEENHHSPLYDDVMRTGVAL